MKKSEHSITIGSKHSQNRTALRVVIQVLGWVSLSFTGCSSGPLPAYEARYKTIQIYSNDPQSSPDPKDPETFTIGQYSTFGLAAPVTEDGYCLTAAHVVKKISDFGVPFRTNGAIPTPVLLAKNAGPESWNVYIYNSEIKSKPITIKKADSGVADVRVVRVWKERDWH